MNKKVNPYKACIYGLRRDFLDGGGYDLGTKDYSEGILPGDLIRILWI